MGKNKLFAHFFNKSLLFMLFLVAIPLFPSHGPFETILSKFWGVVHLLFIGVAVCYGLFSRRSNSEMDDETYPTIEDSQSSYISRIFHVSSIFEDGDGNSCVYDEKNMYQTRYAQYQGSESVVGVGNFSYVTDEQGKTQSFNSEAGFQVPFEQNEYNLTEVRNSEYFRDESMVYTRDERGEPQELPVTSLKSRVRNSILGEFSEETESNSKTTNKNEIFGDLGAMNLEEKFNEAVVSPAHIPWDSRSESMEMKEEMGSASSCPPDFSPISVDETQIEAVKSQSLMLKSSLLSEASTVSYLSTRLCPSHSDNSKLANSEAEELEKKKGFRASYPPVTQSPGRSTLNNGATLNAFHLRRYSSGSLFRKNVKESSEDSLKNLARNIREGSLGTLKLDKKPLSSLESSPRGRSVSTIQDIKFTAEAESAEEKSRNRLKKRIGRTIDEEKVMKTWTNEMEEGKHDKFALGTKLKNRDAQFRTLKPSFEKYSKKEMECDENVSVQSEEYTRIETRKSKDEVAVARNKDNVNESDEIDKKAGEFIAKFREQIKLQKVKSLKGSKGLRTTSNHFR